MTEATGAPGAGTEGAGGDAGAGGKPELGADGAAAGAAAADGAAGGAAGAGDGAAGGGGGGGDGKDGAAAGAGDGASGKDGAAAGDGKDGKDAAAAATGDKRKPAADQTLAGSPDGKAKPPAKGKDKDAGAGDPDAAAAAKWRDDLAGGDAELRKRLDRFASPKAVWDSFLNLERKLSSGEYKKALPTDASPEEVAKWRKDNNIPEKPEAYEVKLGDGLVAGEHDKPLLTAFAQFAHEQNWDNDTYNKAATWFYKHQDALASEREEKDGTDFTATRDSLRDEYGPDFKGNMNALAALGASMPEKLWDRILTARAADGTLIGNDPNFIRWGVALERGRNPMAALVPAGSGDAMAAGEARLKEIRAIATNDPDRYDRDKELQAEELKLIEARDKGRGARSAA